MNFPAVSHLALISLLCGGCLPGTNSSYLQRTSGSANDHIMLVRRDPPTFGFQRLAAHAIAHPDLGVFLRQSGDPDFLAETNKSGNRYLILYYTNSKKQYVCRTGGDGSRQVEFSGPYPITTGEGKTLQGLRDRSEGVEGRNNNPSR
jgi:hypothetical protein